MSELIRETELTCVECKDTFTWSAAAQLLFYDKGKKRMPRRCDDCARALSARQTDFSLRGPKSR